MKPVGVIELPPYTREQAVRDDPDVVWTKRFARAHRSNEQCRRISDYKYEGRS